MATMLKVEVETGGFYVSRHDAKLSTGAVHDGRSASVHLEVGGQAAEVLPDQSLRVEQVLCYRDTA